MHTVDNVFTFVGIIRIRVFCTYLYKQYKGRIVYVYIYRTLNVHTLRRVYVCI